MLVFASMQLVVCLMTYTVVNFFPLCDVLEMYVGNKCNFSCRSLSEVARRRDKSRMSVLQPTQSAVISRRFRHLIVISCATEIFDHSFPLIIRQ